MLTKESDYFKGKPSQLLFLPLTKVIMTYGSGKPKNCIMTYGRFGATRYPASPRNKKALKTYGPPRNKKGIKTYGKCKKALRHTGNAQKALRHTRNTKSIKAYGKYKKSIKTYGKCFKKH